jgi:2-methylcitrate dehydratase
MAKHADTGPSSITALAKWVADLKAADIPAHVFDQARMLVLDTLGCGLAGSGEPTSRAVVECMLGLGGTETCTVIGSAQRTNILNAVLANGCLIRVLDLNDYIGGSSGSGPEIGGHPSDNIPVALAVGEWQGRTGRDVLASIVMGYEIFGRLKRMMDPVGVWDEVTSSGLVAASIAGKLLGLDRVRLSHALALAAARSATPAIVRGGHVSAAKSIANSLVAQSAVQAVLLAARGVTGPLAVLDAPRGIREIYARGEATEILTAPLPQKPYIMRANIKMYPCLATGQSAVAAALKIREAVAGDIDCLEHVDIVMADYPIVQRQQADLDRRRPLSREAADHSFPFLVAASLCDGALGLEQYDNERWLDARITALMQRFTMSTDPAWRDRAPGAYPCTIVARTANGQEIRADVAFPPGYAREALLRDDVVAKFTALTARMDVPTRQIIDAVLSMDDGTSVAPLLHLVGVDVR